MVKPFARGTFKPRIPIRIGSGLAWAGGYGDFFLIGLATLPVGIPRASAFLRPSPPLRACPGFSLVITLRKHHYEQTRDDGIPAELFQILKDNAVKVLHSICMEIWKTQQWPHDCKRSVFLPSERKAMPKDAQTTAQLHTSHTPVK